MAKPAITFRSVKGEALSYSELDTNFTNLKDATFGVTVGANTATIDLNSALTLVAGSNVSLSLNTSTDTLTIASTATGGNAFGRIAVAGQSDVVADSTSDTLTLIAGSNITLTTSAGLDTVTIAATASPTNSFSTIAVSGQSNVVADSNADTLTVVAGDGINIATNATSDTITITATGAVASALLNVVEDTTPQLGGSLDVNGQQIVSVSNGNIVLEPNGTGTIRLDNTIWPKTGTGGQYLAYGYASSGDQPLSWETLDISRDITPQLGGNLDVNGKTLSDALTGTIAVSSNIRLTSTSILGLIGSDSYGLALRNASPTDTQILLDSNNIKVTGSIVSSGTTLTLLNQSGGSGLSLQASGVYLNSPIVFQSRTTTQRNAISTLVAGMVIWNTTDTKLQVYDGTNWQNLH
jgi:hypothetical protein